MKRRIAVLLVTCVLIAGHGVPAFAMSRDDNSRGTVLREVVSKVVKQLKNILRFLPTEELPIPPRP